MLDGEPDRITDYDLEAEIIDLSQVVDVRPQGSLEGFVRISHGIANEVTRIDVDRSGSGTAFVPAVRVEGQIIDGFSAPQLGFPASVVAPSIAADAGSWLTAFFGLKKDTSLSTHWYDGALLSRK